MTLTIVADENIPAVEHYFGHLGQVRRVSGRALQASELADADVLLVRSVTTVDEALLADCRLRFVGSATSGLDHIDREYLARSGTPFAYAPGSNANSVVEYVLAAIAVCDTRLEQLLAGGRVGIVGYGHIGKAMAARLRALGIDRRVYDPWLDRAAVEQPSSLAEVLACDVVTLHAELTSEQPWPSHHLLDAGLLAAIPPASLLVNASRGPVVDNAALLALLARGGGPTTVLDVWEGEPVINTQLLQQVTLGTPHIAGYSLDGKLLATRMLYQALASRLGLAEPEPAWPAAAPQPIELPAPLTGAELVRYLVAAHYDIGADDRALRGVTLGRDGVAAAAGFDQLRRDYRIRRELPGVTVSGDLASPGDLQLVRGLGCLPQNPGGRE